MLLKSAIKSPNIPFIYSIYDNEKSVLGKKSFFFLFVGLLWATKVSIWFAFNFLKGVRLHVFSKLTSRKDFAVKYGGRWAGEHS